MRLDFRGPVARYGFALAITLIALFLTVILWNPLISRFPFLLLFLAMACSSWYGGFTSGLLSACLSSTGFLYFAFLTQRTFRLNETSNIVAFSIFLIIAVVISTLGRRARRVRSEYLVTLASIADAVISTDSEGNVEFLNRVAESLTGWNLEEARGKPLSHIFTIKRESNNQAFENPFVKVRTSGVAFTVIDDAALISRKEKDIPIEASCSPIRDDKGKITGVVLVFRDVSERRAAEAKMRQNMEELQRSEQIIRGQLGEKEVLLAEIHHRVKNNLQIMLSLLNMQARSAPPELKELVAESENRIRAMALIHEKLYASDNFSQIDLPAYMSQLLSNLVRNYSSGQLIETEIQSENTIRLSLQKALACGLIANELVTNALKHAFSPQKPSGKISIRCASQNGQVHLEIKDTGMGLPTGFDAADSKSFGLRLVSLLVKQLDGSLQLSSSVEGTSYSIQFPDN